MILRYSTLSFPQSYHFDSVLLDQHASSFLPCSTIMIILFNLKNSGNIFHNSMLTGTHNTIKLTFTSSDFTSSFKPKASISDCLSSNSTYPNPLSLPWSVGSLTLTTYNQDIKIYKLIVHIQIHHKISFFFSPRKLRF